MDIPAYLGIDGIALHFIGVPIIIRLEEGLQILDSNITCYHPLLLAYDFLFQFLMTEIMA